MGGSAVALAADEIAAQARALAAGRDMTLAEIAAAAPEPLHAQRRFTTDVTMSSGAHAAVVEIERATGVLRILPLRRGRRRRARSSTRCSSTARSSAASSRASAQCLTEEVVHDETGQPRTASLLDYGLPTSAEIPPLRLEEVGVALAAEPARRQGDGRGRRDRRAARARQRRRRRARRPPRRPAVHGREAVAGAAGGGPVSAIETELPTGVPDARAWTRSRAARGAGRCGSRRTVSRTRAAASRRRRRRHAHAPGVHAQARRAGGFGG